MTKLFAEAWDVAPTRTQQDFYGYLLVAADLAALCWPLHYWI